LTLGAQHAGAALSVAPERPNRAFLMVRCLCHFGLISTA
jgi:hypothetical protein